MSAEKILHAQLMIAVKHTAMMLPSNEPTPKEIYLGILAEYGLDFLPKAIMDSLVEQWTKDSSLGHTGNVILLKSKLNYRNNQ